MFNENVKFKQCVINDVSYGCGLLTFSVSTKGFKRYSTGLKRVREVLESTFDEHSANMLLIELYRAEDNSFDDGCISVRSGHSYFGGVLCKYVVDFYYSSAEHFKGNTYVKSMVCVFSVYLRGDTALSDVLLSSGLLSALFAEDTKDTTEDTKDTTEDTKDTTEDTKDTTEDTKDTTEDTKDTTEDTTSDTSDTTTIILGALDSVQVVENKPFLPPIPLSELRRCIEKLRSYFYTRFCHEVYYPMLWLEKFEEDRKKAFSEVETIFNDDDELPF